MAKFLVLILSVFLGALVFIGQNADACGITTHTEIAHRAASNYEHLLDNQTSISQLIKKYQAAFQAGNPYPDSFYPSICKKGVFHEVSEDTHWVPFLNATIKYIQKKYSKPYNEDALRLIVFTLGYTSHQIADVTWHALGVPQGFLSAMGFVNFHGSFDKAHSVGDPGGDIVNQFELNMNFISDLGDWYIPYKDLYEIYYQYYGREAITTSTIIECSSLLFAGRLAEQVAIALLYADYYKKSSFLADKLYDYYLGGIDDMATWTQISWDKVLFMLETEVEKCKLDHNIIYINCTQEAENLDKYRSFVMNMDESRMMNKKSREPTFYADKLNIDASYVDMSLEGNGLILKPSSKFQKMYGHLLKNNSTPSSQASESSSSRPSSTDTSLKGNVLQANSTYFTMKDYANLGWTMESADLNNDKCDDLIIGAPVYSNSNTYQDGAVFIIMADPSTGTVPLEILNVDTSASIVLHPPDKMTRSRFGHSVTVLDINQDGYNDLVVSAPSYGLQDINYEGRVMIYLGDSTMKYDQPAIQVTCKNFHYCNIGWTLTKGDVNGDKIDDLIIGSPYAATCGDQCGLVATLFGGKKAYPSVIDVSNFDWVLNGSMPYEWFGYSIKNKFGYLAISAPETRICYHPTCDFDEKDIQAVGSINLYAYPSKEPMLTMRGDFDFEQYGYSFDLSMQNQKLILSVGSVSRESILDRKIGALALNRAGVVQNFDITNAVQPRLISVLKSDRPYAQFGSRIKYFKPSNADHEDLYISANMRTNDISLLNQIQEGVVFRFEGGKNFPMGNVTDNCGLTSLVPCPYQKADLIFGSSEVKARLGFDFVFLTSAYQPSYQVAISSIHSNNFYSRLSGSVSLFTVPS